MKMFFEKCSTKKCNYKPDFVYQDKVYCGKCLPNDIRGNNNIRPYVSSIRCFCCEKLFPSKPYINIIICKTCENEMPSLEY